MARTIIAALAVLLTMTTANAQQTSGQPAQQGAGQRVRLAGCVSGAVETGCVVLWDRTGSVGYNITSAQPRPDPGRAINVTGVVSNQMSFCMQGPVLEQIKWSYTKGRCTTKSP